MEAPQSELRSIAARLILTAEKLGIPTVLQPLDKLEAAAETVGRSASGSWIGNHSLVYYAGFEPRPAGALFSQEWGFMAVFAPGTKGDWREFTVEEVRTEIFLRAGGAVDLEPIRSVADQVRSEVARQIEAIKSILLALGAPLDQYLSEALERARDVKAPTVTQVLTAWRPDSVVTRDSAAASQGLMVPPHLGLLAEVVAVRATRAAAEQLSTVAEQAAEHIDRRGMISVDPERLKGRVFIGHGNSFLWRELKDFIADRLHLPWDEFNRVPVAGIANTSRLVQMLDSAGIALLVLTAEDEQEDGTLHARQNVIHETGLFQGRLGFQRAIILLEEGCGEFSNISGLGQIRFPPRKISAVFEELREVLEREGFLDAEASGRED